MQSFASKVTQNLNLTVKVLSMACASESSKESIDPVQLFIAFEFSVLRNRLTQFLFDDLAF